MQERGNSIANALELTQWSYVYLAITHQNVDQVQLFHMVSPGANELNS